MSAGEVERLVSELSGGTGGDEEEEWLYGGPWDVHVHTDLAKDLDENEVERPEEENASANPPSGVEDEAAENGVPKPVEAMKTDVSTGPFPPTNRGKSYGTAPVNLNIKTGGRVYGTTGTKVKGVDLDAPGSINGVPLLEVDLDSFEDKPWRKPGADLSDYFNYGFNEDTWKAYCEKQKRIRMGLEVIPVTSTTNKITAEDCTMEVTPGAEIQDGRFNLFKVQQGRTGNSEKEPALPSSKAEFTSPPSLFKTGLPPSRNSTSSQSQTSTASRKGNSSVAKWQDRYGRAESPDLRRLPGAIDVIGQTITISRVEGRRRANENSNIQVLSERSATEVDNNFSKPRIPITVPPPGFPPPPGAPPPSLIPTIESGHSSGYDSRSARAFPYGNDRDRDRERERTRERERERDHSPTPSVFNSDEERYRYREYAERGYERHRASREKEERHRERRHREKEETRHKSSRSNSRRRHESEEGDSHRRHKHKKSKRSKEGKEAGSEPAPEQESSEAAPAE
ncbi:pre-mRNA 3'-end-processing factor FIP1 [Echinops telfairi]|uniref:Pre-mRNA 3'-end-processing factor FIP1 n=1 Tax=Echinops telfairi TaxID=9371 RepID=A0ABM0IRY0_ECHTE|nr:pre-mRNA 3'-end-processing factor FIP1 [Echinops telfairi]